LNEKNIKGVSKDTWAMVGVHLYFFFPPLACSSVSLDGDYICLLKFRLWCGWVYSSLRFCAR
jgi:hypothetical protein